MNQGVRDYVLRRDRCCFLYRLDDTHVCYDQWGNVHKPNNLSLLTVDHVKDGLMMGLRAPSDAAHLVAMCHRGNVAVPSREVRAAEREYLRKVEA